MATKKECIRFFFISKYSFITGYEIKSVNPTESVCVGETVSLKTVVTGAEEEFVVEWLNESRRPVVENKHFSMNRTVLTINNALPLHKGLYYAAARYVTQDYHSAFTIILLKVKGI